jgi:UDP-GlcNAc:undecaprenyl-phosphate GlcNAc-1-phosphate transferase
VNYALPFIVAVIISLSFTLITKQFALRFGRIAEPREDRWHKTPTALFGGVAIFFSFMASSLIFVSPITKEFLGILAGGTFLFVTGIVDDLHSIKPYTKLIAQIIAASITIFFGIKMQVLTPFISVPITVLWIVAVTNAFNLLDNMDGLSAGIACITAIILSVVSALLSRWELVTISLIIAGTCLGFLRYNFHPASIFMGDCGSMFLGFTIGTLSIAGTYRHASNLIMTIAVPVLVMAIPIFDTILVSIMRNLTGRSVSQGGKDHISHRLVILGLSEKKAVLALYVLSMAIGTIAILYSYINFYVITILGTIVLIGLFFLGVFLGETKVYSDKELDMAKEKIMGNGSKTVLNSEIFHKRQIVEVLVDFTLIVIAYISAYLLRFEGSIPEGDMAVMIKSFPILILAQLISFYYFGLYKKIWRYIGLSDVTSIVKAVTVGTIATVIIILLFTRFYGYSRAVFIIYWLILIVLATSARGALRLFREHFAEIQKTKGKRVLIYGAGDAGSTLLREIKNNPELNYKVIGFLDDDFRKTGRRIYGKSVIGSKDDLSRIARDKRVEEVLVAISSLSEDNWQHIGKACEDNGLHYRRMGRIL